LNKKPTFWAYSQTKFGRNIFSRILCIVWTDKQRWLHALSTTRLDLPSVSVMINQLH